jgi:uncharacterized repeat protein (TIGR02543 family)
MLKKFTWLAAARLAALAMAFFGCTDAGTLDDDSAPRQANDLVLEGDDIVLKACGQSSSKVVIDGNKVTLDGNNTGFYFDFPAEAADYAQIQVFFEIIEVMAGTGPGLLIKRNTSFQNPIGVANDQAPEYQLNNVGPAGTKFDTGKWNTNRFDKQMAFQNQIYNPAGNADSKFTVAVLKIVFPGGGGPSVEIPPPAYTQEADVVYAANGSGRVDDTVTDNAPSIIGDHGMTITSSGVVTMTENSILKYKFPTSAKVGSGANATTRAIDIEKDFDIVEFTFAITNVVKTSGGTGNFKVSLSTYDGATAYGINPGANYQNYTDFGDGTAPATIQAWGAYGSGGVTINYNYGDRDSSGADSMDVKLTKVTFKNSQRWKVTFYDGSSAGATYDIISGNTINKANIPTSVTAPTKAGYTFTGWSTTEGGTTPSTAAITADTGLYAIWTVTIPETKPDLSKVSADVTPATGTLFNAAGSYLNVTGTDTAGATITYDGKSWWIVADSRTAACWNNPVAPFDTTAAADFTAIKTAQDSYGDSSGSSSMVGYSRIGLDLSTVTEFAAIFTANNYRWYDKVTITYDMRAISGADPLNARFLNDANASANGFGYPNLEPGDGKTITFTRAQFASGGIGITKNNVGAMLLRITKIELEQD